MRPEDAETVPPQRRWRESGSTHQNRIVAGQRHEESGGGGNRTCPNRLYTSGTVGLQRKVSPGGVNLVERSRCRVDAVNALRALSAGVDRDDREGRDPGEVVDVHREHGELVGHRRCGDECVERTSARLAARRSELR